VNERELVGDISVYYVHTTGSLILEHPSCFTDMNESKKTGDLK